MACDITALEAELAQIDADIATLRAQLVSQATGSTTTGGRKVVLAGPKGGKVEYQEGSSGSTSSVRDALKCLVDERKRVQRDLNRCKRGGRSISPQLTGVDVTGNTGGGCNGC